MERLRMLSSLVHPVEKSTAAFASVVLGVIEATVHCAAEVTSHSKFSERWRVFYKIKFSCMAMLLSDLVYPLCGIGDITVVPFLKTASCLFNSCTPFAVMWIWLISSYFVVFLTPINKNKCNQRSILVVDMYKISMAKMWLLLLLGSLW